MDHKEITSIWDAFQAVQEKKLSDKQKALDVDNDGDIEGDDLAALRNKKNKADVVEEVPAAHNKKAPARKGDKSNAMPSEWKKEEVEQVDELSKNLLRRYKGKADAQSSDHMSKIDRSDPKNPKNPSAASSANFKKRSTGSNNAHDKIKGKYARVPATNANKGRRVEEVEQVDEISQGLKNRYVKKAAMSTASNAHSDGIAMAHGSDDVQKKHKDKVLKRLKGIGRATKESVEESAWLQDLAVVLQGIEEKKDEHTKGATAPEVIASKESNKAKDFIDLHKKSDKEWEDKEEQGHDDVSKAGRATKPAAGRKSDQLKNGDKAIVKPVAKK